MRVDILSLFLLFFSSTAYSQGEDYRDEVLGAPQNRQLLQTGEGHLVLNNPKKHTTKCKYEYQQTDVQRRTVLPL